MCRGFQQSGRGSIKLRAFYIHMSISTARKSLPDFMTLQFLPRIDESPLEINGSSIRPDAPGFVALHRVVSAEAAVTGAVYGSRDRVKTSEGARFEIHAGDSRVKGIFRKDLGDNLKLDCECAVSKEEENGRMGIKAAEVCVSVEGHATELITDKVEMVHPRRLRRRRRYQGLEEIPEGRETEIECEEGSGCCCGEEEEEMGGGDCEVAAEGVGWAVDVAIWMACLGVGYLVSRASRKSLKRRLVRPSVSHHLLA